MEDKSDKTDPTSGIDYLKLTKKYEKYEYFKKTVDFSPGWIFIKSHQSTTDLVNFPEFQYKADLRFVRIYLETPTFDKITKDQSSKIEDKISTIGGNLGLLLGKQKKICLSNSFPHISSGFSIVSGVEIIFFIVTTILRGLSQKSKDKKNQVWKY